MAAFGLLVFLSCPPVKGIANRGVKLNCGIPGRNQGQFGVMSCYLVSSACIESVWIVSTIGYSLTRMFSPLVFLLTC
jgi:hypothetical protein